MLTGPNGLLTQANEAKTKTSEAGAKEKVQIAVASSWEENGFSAKKFETEVGRFNGEITSGEEEFPIKVTVDGHNFEVSNEGIVTEKDDGDQSIPAELAIGDYVEYGVTYKDVYSYHDFTASTGWRVLSTGTKNADGTYSGVKLISTGVPARLSLFYWNNISNYENDGTEEANGKWSGNTTDRQKYMTEFGIEESEHIGSGNYYIRVSSGLYYNFEKTLYDEGKEPKENDIGKGCYKEINGKKQGEISGREFKIDDKVKEVHNLTLKELNDVLGKEYKKWDIFADIDLLKLFWLDDKYRGLGYYENIGDNNQNGAGLDDRWFDYWLAFTGDGNGDWYEGDNLYAGVNESGCCIDDAGNVNYDEYCRRHTSSSYFKFRCL